MRSSIRQTFIATTALIGLSAFAAVAAPPVAGDPTASAPTTKAQPTTGRHMAANIDQRIKDLHARLQITAAQQPQWDQFAAVMRANAQTMDETFQYRMQALPTMTATENMESYATVAQNHAQEMQKLVPAFEALYGTMSDAQKHNADMVFRSDAKKPHHG